MQQAAWTKVAEREGLPPPDSDRNVFNMRPERAITDVSHALAHHEELTRLIKPSEGNELANKGLCDASESLG